MTAWAEAVNTFNNMDCDKFFIGTIEGPSDIPYIHLSYVDFPTEIQKAINGVIIELNGNYYVKGIALSPNVMSGVWAHKYRPKY